MRQITKDAIIAFRKGAPFSRDNTSVELSPLGNVVVLKLHGNTITRYDVGDFNSLEICDGGWASNTTKERLNGINGVHIHQRDYVWYLNDKEWSGNWTRVY